MSNPLFDSPLTQLAIDRNNLTAAIVAILLDNDFGIVNADPSTGRIDLTYNNHRYFLQLRLRK